MTPRRTPQLAAVLAVVSAARDHPTAEQVHERVRASLPAVSLGTVYRNLVKLAADGHVSTLQLGDRAVRYDGMIEPHDHFLCETCGALLDLEPAAALRPAIDDLTRAGFGIRGQTTTFFGRCADCNLDRPQ